MKPRITALALVLLPLAALPAGGQNQLWIEQFGSSYPEGLKAAAPDGTGGVFAGGWINTTGGFGWSDVWLTRYDDTGTQLWMKQFGAKYTERLSAAAPDGSGGVFVGGSTNSSFGGPIVGDWDVWLARFDSDGNQVWILQTGTAVGEGIRAAAPDETGGVYVCGRTGGSFGGTHAGSDDAWFARYDNTGNQTWIVQIGTSSDESAGAAAPDGSGGFYVGGGTMGSLGAQNAGGSDAWWARYDDAGNQLWIRQIGTSGNESINAISSDGEGGVYVSGSTNGNLGGTHVGGHDFWLARYDDAGTLLWIRQFGSSSDEVIGASAPMEAGGVYLGGWTNPQYGLGHVWVGCYDDEGNQVWTDQLGSNWWSEATAAAPDEAGGFFVGGKTQDDLSGTSAGLEDAWIARYASGDLGTPFCFGDPGSGTPCPCNNDNDGSVPESGCANGVFASGAQLTGSGMASLVNDTVVLSATHLEPSNSGLYFQADNDLSPGLVWGDGLRCAGGGLRRLQVRFADGDGSSSTTIGISAKAGNISPGDTKYYQCWYRNPLNSPCGYQFNASNGYAITWTL